ncbi:MAG TPA: hypothetical protein VNR87_04385 [Flavisolibacter sp.]|nr:hypothetical protein [Flavisolibacter sp.]
MKAVLHFQMLFSTWLFFRIRLCTPHRHFFPEDHALSLPVALWRRRMIAVRTSPRRPFKITVPALRSRTPLRARPPFENYNHCLNQPWEFSFDKKYFSS